MSADTGPNGLLTDFVQLDGSSDGLTDEDLERFIAGFPVEAALVPHYPQPAKHDHGSRKHMRAVIRRLRRLEDRFGPPIETEFSRRLGERLEGGRRRLAQLRGEAGISISEQIRENLVGLGVTEILQRGRERE